jgi:predicted GNAT family acetyltransferase
MWGGPNGLASSGFAWGAFVAGQLVSVACTGFLGETYEDIGIVTEPGFRGLGLSPICVLALCSDIRARGHQPSWSTSPDNLASVRVAEKCGFVRQRDDLLYVVGVSIPEPARRPAR